MWPTGAAAAAVFALLLGALGVEPGLGWRLVLAFGCVPAISVLYLRREMPETARYLSGVAGDPAGATEVVLGLSSTPRMPAPRHRAGTGGDHQAVESEQHRLAKWCRTVSFERYWRGRPRYAPRNNPSASTGDSMGSGVRWLQSADLSAVARPLGRRRVSGSPRTPRRSASARIANLR